MVIVRELDSVMVAFIITEINISEDIKTLLCVSGYERFTISRASGTAEGLSVYVKEGWCTTPITITMTHSEHMSVQISRHDFSVILIAIYRPPANNVNLFLKDLDKALSEFSPINHLCLVGDFNINTASSSRPTVCDYLNLMETYGIKSTIQSPTWEEFLGNNFVSSCIDHINLLVFDGTVKVAVISERLADNYFIACQIML